MAEILYVCLTCDRYRTRPPGMPSCGTLLMRAISVDEQGLAEHVRIRTVECLNGCPHPCNAALRALGKASIRLSRLTPQDGTAVRQLTRLYAESSDGLVPARAIPPRLRTKISQYEVQIPRTSSEESSTAR